MQQKLAERLEALAGRLAEAGEAKIEEAGLRDTVAAIGVCVDRAQLLRGKATANIRVTGNLLFGDLTEEELERRVAEAEGREAAPAVPEGSGAVCPAGAGRDLVGEAERDRPGAAAA